MSFVSCDDGIVRVQGIDLKEIPHLFDISIIDGNVYLTEDGRDIDGQASLFSIDGLTSLFTTEPQPKSKSRLDSFGERAAENMNK